MDPRHREMSWTRSTKSETTWMTWNPSSLRRRGTADKRRDPPPTQTRLKSHQHQGQWKMNPLVSGHDHGEFVVDLINFLQEQRDHDSELILRQMVGVKVEPSV